MLVVLTKSVDGYAQLITILIVFVVVLAATAFTSKWIADYQKQQQVNCNIEIIETSRISNNKYIQIVRVGKTYKVIAVCKDTVTLLGEVPGEQLIEKTSSQGNFNFKELLEHTIKKDSSKDSELKE